MVIARSCHALVVVLTLGALLSADRPITAQEEPPAPGEGLVGSWRADLSDTQALLLEVRGATVEMKMDSGGTVTSLWEGKVTFLKEHADRHFDWVQIKAGNRALPDNKCLYKRSGDTLLVIGGGPNDRPTKILSGPGTGSRTLVFTRVGRVTK